MIIRRVVVYSPQIIENYQLKSGEGLSVFFVVIWLAGDLASLFGAILARLMPTIIILAAYVRIILVVSIFPWHRASQYTVCDITLLIQIYYYRWRHSSALALSPLIPEADVPGDLPSEETPLISEARQPREKSERSITAQCLIYGSALIFVLATGVMAWAIDERMHKGQPRETPEEVSDWRSQVLGWISAILYRES
jgi:solute carrier family 66 (lysosomal lysine-arginine transporter), member 1